MSEILSAEQIATWRKSGVGGGMLPTLYDSHEALRAERDKWKVRAVEVLEMRDDALSEVSRLREAIDKADGALIRWGKHEDGCGYSWPHHIQWADCTCGLHAANDALRALTPPVPQEDPE
jgi:hypothetical protein